MKTIKNNILEEFNYFYGGQKLNNLRSFNYMLLLVYNVGIDKDMDMIFSTESNEEDEFQLEIDNIIE